VPDCSDLRRRGAQCEPFCDAADVFTPSNGNDGGENSSSSSSSVPIWLVVVIVLSVALVVTVIAVSIQRPRHSSRQQKHKASPQQQHTMTMFMNPLHAGFAPSGVAEHQINNDDFQQPPRDVVTLDSDLYVQPSSDATNEAAYSLFRAPAVGRGAQATDAPTYALFRSPDATA
jgi:hypothetical protein